MNSLRNQKICLTEFDKERTIDLRVRLSKKFQYRIFSELIDKYSAIELTRMLNISQPMVYHYRNCRVDNISFEMLNKIIGILKLEEVEDNITEVFDKNKLLDFGREIRKNQLKDFKNKIPKVSELIDGNFLNLEKWFLCYQKLINFGCREIKNIQIGDNSLKVTYTNYANGKKKTFAHLFPRKIKIDQDFQYFFGLWVGDKAGGGRIGVMNKNRTINLYTAYYLARLCQKTEFVLYIHNEEAPHLDYKIDKIIRIKSLRKGYAISVHTVNRILKSFFEYLENDLDNILDLIPNKNIFFAGLFDAEGNIFLEDKCFRWSSKNEINIKIFTKHLKELGLFKRFDGSNLVTDNKEAFSKEILPYLKHPNKINDVNLILSKTGILSTRFKIILQFINGNPGKSKKEIAKALKRVKVYSQLKFLEYLGLIRMEDYPHKMFITIKGSEALLRGGKDI